MRGSDSMGFTSLFTVSLDSKRVFALVFTQGFFFANIRYLLGSQSSRIFDLGDSSP